MAKKRIGDSLDKFRNHLLKGSKLTSEQEILLERYKICFTYLCNGYSYFQAVKLIGKKYDLSTSVAYKITRETVELFGNAGEASEKGMKHIMYEYFMRLSREAYKDGKYNEAIRAAENAAKIKGAYAEEMEGLDPAVFLIPVPIEYTSDPKALDVPTIDIEHEEEK